VSEEYVGASFEPIWYIGTQVVNGVNHKLLCRETLATRYKEQHIVTVTINIPAGSVGGEGATLVKVEREAELTPEVELIFKKATSKLLGVGYTPVVYIGKQVVKGMNYYFVAEARVSYPEAVPYAVTMTINQFGTAATATEISPIQEPGLSSDFGK
jgi:hypothetical protein